MVQISHQTHDIQRVQEVHSVDGGVQVVFPTGLSVCLRAGHPDYDRILRHARSSVEHGEPVGFTVSEAGDLLELHYTHKSAVRHVQPDVEDPGRLMVAFWEYSPICYLTKDHPEFERIKGTLERAASMDEQVLLANHMHMVEGEAESWWRIMDVRPA